MVRCDPASETNWLFFVRISRKSLQKSRGEVLDVAEHEAAELGFMFEDEDGSEDSDDDKVTFKPTT